MLAIPHFQQIPNDQHNNGVMPHLHQQDFRIPLPQLPPLPFEPQAGGDCDVQYQSPGSLESSSSNSTKPWASAKYTKAQMSTDERALLDKNTGMSFTKPGDDSDSSATAMTSTRSKTVAPGRAQDWLTRWFLEWWMMEILSWFFGLICMVIIATVLWKYDGRPDPQWKIGLSIGSFISIFSGFAKSALLLPTAEALGQLKWDWFRRSDTKVIDFERLDSASRGPLGSFVLLIRTRKVTLATIGAAIVLLSLPLDGFFQRIISYPSVHVLDTSNATISRAILYDPTPEAYLVNGSRKLTPDLQLDSVTAPFRNSQGPLPGVSFDCPTSNCTFDPFYTLALDFQCRELAPSLDFECRNASAEWLSTTDYYDIMTNGKPMPWVYSCGYFLDVPDLGKQLMSGYEVAPDNSIGEILTTRFFPVMDLATNEQYWNGSYALMNVSRVSVTDFIVSSTPGSFDGASHNNTPVLTECEVHWVVKKIAATVSNGRLFEEALDTLQFKSDLQSPWDVIDGSIFAVNFTMTLPDPHSFTGNTSTFGLDNVTAFKVFEVWEEIAPSTFILSPDDGSGPLQKYFWPASPPRLIMVKERNSPWDPPNNITQHMSNAVEAQNQVLRRNSNSQREELGSNVAVGKAWKSLQVVKVQWAWLSMPLSLLIISGLFLAATVVRSSKEKLGIYKNSALASLFSDLDDQENVELSNSRRSHMNTRAKNIRGSRLIIPGAGIHSKDGRQVVLAT